MAMEAILKLERVFVRIAGHSLTDPLHITCVVGKRTSGHTVHKHLRQNVFPPLLPKDGHTLFSCIG